MKKNSSKADLRKLAKLGLATGLILVANQGLNADSGEWTGQSSNNNYFSANSCGGCHATSGWNQPQYQAQSGCSTSSGWNNQPQYAQSGCSTFAPNQPQYAQSGCATYMPNPSSGWNTADNNKGYTETDKNPPEGSSTSRKQSYADADKAQWYKNEFNMAEADQAPGMKQQGNYTESTLRAQLKDDQVKAMFDNLSPEGKALAVKWANSGNYKDRNEAVKAAMMKMAEKRNQMQMNK
jgi:hypothetical protein